MLDLVQVSRIPGLPDEEITDPAERTFHVPDMNCQHCRATIGAVLTSMGITVPEIDPVTKRIIAGFETARGPADPGRPRRREPGGWRRGLA